MPARLGNFFNFVVLTIITIGLYPLFFFVTRQQETVELLKDIKEELKKS
jgi:NADH:ubiquinone oxidoreductase subunit 4 (subunit M)